MEDLRQDNISNFDVLFTNNHIRMLKVLMPFIDSSMRKNIAVCIKYLELQYTMQNFKYLSKKLESMQRISSTEVPLDFSSICDQIIPYCTAHEKHQFTQMRNLFSSIQNIQEMMEMMEVMKELFPDSMSNDDGDQSGFNPEILTAMSSIFSGTNIDFSQLTL